MLSSGLPSSRGGYRATGSQSLWTWTQEPGRTQAASEIDVLLMSEPPAV